MGKEKVSIYTIAREAGVSTATVSRVLTGSAAVSDEKKRKVEELIQRYDFRPSAPARSLSNVETRLIGLLVADIRNPFYATMAVECEKAANERGYMLLLSNSLGNRELESAYLERFYSQRVDALIQIGGHVDALDSDADYVKRINRIAQNAPVLITGKLEGADCYRVNIDEGQSMEILIRFLMENGHRRIAMVGGRGNVKSTADKRQRYRLMLEKYGITVREDYIVDGENYDIESGYEAMSAFLAGESPLPSAVIAINDFTAVGVVRAIVNRGLRIPEDISVVSFDNTYIAQACQPCLTCVGYDYRLFGQLLVETAVKIIHHEPVPRVQKVESRLVIRDSCRSMR